MMIEIIVLWVRDINGSDPIFVNGYRAVHFIYKSRGITIYQFRYAITHDPEMDTCHWPSTTGGPGIQGRMVKEKNIQHTLIIFPEHDTLIVLVHEKRIKGDRINSYAPPIIQHIQMGTSYSCYLITIQLEGTSIPDRECVNDPRMKKCGRRL